VQIVTARWISMRNIKAEPARLLKRLVCDVDCRILLADADAVSLASLGEAA
jgi:hypothetical protein